MIRRRNIDPGSTIRGPASPIRVLLPASDPGGFADYTPTAIGEKVPLSGAYCQNISTDTFSADIKIPCQICITSAANADTWALRVDGRDHLGNERSEFVWKGNNLRQIEANGMICWSYIRSITIVGASTIAARLRLGFMYSSWGLAAVDLDTAVTTGNGASRRIPIPYAPIASTDVTIDCIGTIERSVVSYSPVGATLTYGANSLTATVSAWAFDTVDGVKIGDFITTYDGFVGRIGAFNEGTQVLTATDGFFRNGAAGTPATVVGAANKFPAARIIRPGFVSTYSATLGGMYPSSLVVASAPVTFTSAAISCTTYTYTRSAGVDVNTSTFGSFIFTKFYEPLCPVEFLVYVKNGAAY